MTKHSFKLGTRVSLNPEGIKGIVARSGRRSEHQKGLVFILWDDDTVSFEPPSKLEKITRECRTGMISGSDLP